MQEANVKRAPTTRGWSGILARPVLLAGVLLWLYIYVNGRELDSIEQRSINAESIRQRLVEHVELVAVSTLIVIAIGVPLGALLSRKPMRTAERTFLPVAGLLQATPTIGVMVLLGITVGFGSGPALFALVLASLLPVIVNTVVGLRSVDDATVDSARAMGMSAFRTLVTVEFRIALSTIISGIRTALVVNVGAATLATYINGGGLGTIIVAGITNNRPTVLLVGSVLTAVLALFVDWLAGLVRTFSFSPITRQR